MWKKIVFSIIILIGVLGTIWFLFFTLDQEPISRDEIIASYNYSAPDNINFTTEKIGERQYLFTFTSFDGQIVRGRISYPRVKAEKYPVLIGIHAMGRSAIRWFQGSFKDTPTVTQVNKITELADSKGYVVIALDARYHGLSKNPDKTLNQIMYGMWLLGNKDDYVKMVHHTVLDHRILLDWILTQENLDHTNIKAAGYSMGAQISLLLSSLDDRITSVIAIVPPFLDDKLALVAPKNLVPVMSRKPLLLLIADDDENATGDENKFLYSLIKNPQKRMIEFEGSHILPDGYVNRLKDEF